MIDIDAVIGEMDAGIAAQRRRRDEATAEHLAQLAAGRDRLAAERGLKKLLEKLAAWRREGSA